MKGRPWAKFDVGMPRDAKVSTLSEDGARWAFVAVILSAKEADRPGLFENLDHLKAVLSASVAKHIPELIEKGLLVEDPEGVIHVAAWRKYQIDPTKPERAARYREKVKKAEAGPKYLAIREPGKPTSIAEIVRGVQK